MLLGDDEAAMSAVIKAAVTLRYDYDYDYDYDYVTVQDPQVITTRRSG